MSMKTGTGNTMLMTVLLLAGTCLTSACTPDKPQENTPAIRQQLNEVQLSLDDANKAAEDRLKAACADNPDC
jgi:hypothetical protein